MAQPSPLRWRGLLPSLKPSQTTWRSGSARTRQSDSVICRLFRARLAQNNGDPSKAVELLQAAIPYDLSTPRSSIHGNFGQLYTIYVRGEAHLAQRQEAEAAAEFQKFPDHRGIVVMDPTGALTHLQLGRAFALSGDKTKAKAAYEAFLNVWKEADADIPILKQAKAEYARI